MFSVFITVWNARETLERAVRSVLAQDFREFELIVVDDGSTDGSLSALPDPRDPRIVVLEREHRGMAAARNVGLRAATHDWIAFLDADDIWHPGHLTELDRIRRRFPDAGLIGTRFVETDFSGRFEWPPDEEGVIELIPYFERFGRGPQPLSFISAAVSRRATDDVGGFGPHVLGTDTELFTRIALRHPVAASTRTTAVYFHGTGGASESASRRWEGARLRSAADVSPAVATLLAECAKRPPDAVPPGVDEFVDRYVGWCLRTSFYIGDHETVASLRPLYRGRPPWRDRVLLAVGARPAGARLRRAWRRLRRALP
jgi:glycosyltransferase involved in cell wall biosynthesis